MSGQARVINFVIGPNWAYIGPMTITPHPLSQALYAELLNRPSPKITPGNVIVQWTLLAQPTPANQTKDIKEVLSVLCGQLGVPVPGPENHHHFSAQDLYVRWEQHTEFNSVLLMAPNLATLHKFPTEWLSETGLVLLTGSLITLWPESADDWLDGLAGCVGGCVLSQGAEVATTLRPNSDGLVEYRIKNRSLDPTQIGRLVQRLYEIETYRMMALMGLPMAKQTNQALNIMENQLLDLVKRLGQTSDLSEDQALLNELFALAQTSEQYLADTDYRFSATKAYGRIVQDRLDELGETATEQRQTLREFLERRFEPALRTTANVTRRQESLSARIARTVSLARTRVEVTLQTQHRTQLEAMARRAQLQLRLQRTVEGLSVMAISYYTIGIVAYLLGGWMSTDSVKWLISITSPLLLLTIWWLLKRWRRQLMSIDHEVD